ncbi:MAG: carboxyl-terminal processing protease [Myxococcota bacterium]
MPRPPSSKPHPSSRPFRADWSTPSAPGEPAAARYIRWGVAVTSFLIAAVLLLSMEFADRGHHFERDRYASNVMPDTGEGYDLARLRVLTRCIGYVRANYVDPDRADARAMLLAALDDVERRVPEFRADPTFPADASSGRASSVTVSVAEQKRTFDLSRVDDLYTMSWKLLDIFEYVAPRLSRTVDPKQVEYAAVNGMLRTLDPHSVLLTPSVYNEMRLGTSGKFGGLGIVIGTQDGRLVVQSVMDGTPARRAGVRSGDRIVQIEAESTVNMSLRDAVKRLRGLPGTPVNIWIERKSFSSPRKFRIVRSNITLASVTSELLADGIGYAHIKSFQQQTGADLESAVRDLTTEYREGGGADLRGFIMDLRDNPGGLLEQAIDVSNLFLGDGVIVTTVGSGNKVREEKVASALNTWSDLPLIVLVNSGSASASEIVAGALRNNDRAVLLGTQTFGKGSVQVLYDIDDAALKLTIAQYLTPGDESIQSVGITPHVELVPISVGELVNLNSKPLGGENTLANHLDNGTRIKHHVPLARIDYLRPESGERKSDFSVQLAIRMLKSAGRASAREQLARSRPLFDVARDEQSKIIVEALGKRNINWNDGRNPKRFRLKATLEAEEEDGQLEAGQKVTFKLTVTNTGNAPVYRVRGVSASPLEVFSGYDFALGHIPAGETRSWRVSVDVPRSAGSQRVPVTVTLFSGPGEEPLEHVLKAETHVEIEGLPRPRFGFSMQVEEIKGNGDGVASEKETLRVRLQVRNVGRGRAHKTLVALKNRGGEEVFITAGRTWLDGLAPGESREAQFELEVREGVPQAGLDLDLQITDTVLGQRMTQRLPLPFVRGVEQTLVESNELWTAKAELTVAGSTDEAKVGALTIGTLASGVALLSDARFGPWLRIPLETGGHGWVRSDAVAPIGDVGEDAKRRVPQAATLARTTPILQPDIALSGDRVLETQHASIELSGTVHFPWIEAGETPDVYVFRDSDKVYFKRTTADQPGTLPFKASVPLNEGLNEVAIYARAGRDLRFKERVWVLRTR